MNLPKLKHEIRGKVSPPDLNDPEKVRRIIARMKDENPRKAELQAHLRRLENAQAPG